MGDQSESSEEKQASQSKRFHMTQPPNQYKQRFSFLFVQVQSKEQKNKLPESEDLKNKMGVCFCFELMMMKMKQEMALVPSIETTSEIE